MALKKHIVAIATVIIITALALLLTSTKFDSVDTLLRPPKNIGQNFEIQSAFEASVNDKYILRSPLSGEYKSSFILVDFDNDKDDEVIVFYSLSGTPDVARLNILDSIDGKWKSVADFESGHSQVHKVDFSDIDKDGTREIIVGWSISDTELNNTINVYKLKSESGNIYAEKIFENSYVEFAVCDVNSDLKSDILLFDKFHSETVSLRATYFDFGNNGSKKSGEFLIDPIISSVHTISSDTDKNNGNTRFYIDGYRLDNSMTTDMFYWNNKEKTFNRYNEGNAPLLSSLATRSTVITCKDVDNDGIIEIPFEEFINKSEVVSTAKSLEKQQNIIKWVKCSNSDLSVVHYEIFNQNNYSLKIKKDWVGNFTVINEPEKGLLTFYSAEEYSGNDSSIQEETNDGYDEKFEFGFDTAINNRDNSNALFTILSTAENESSIYDLSGYKFLKNDDGYNYFYHIYKEGKKWDITKESLKKILVTGDDEK